MGGRKQRIFSAGVVSMSVNEGCLGVTIGAFIVGLFFSERVGG